MNYAKKFILEKLAEALQGEYAAYRNKLTGLAAEGVDALPDEALMGILVFRQLMNGQYSLDDLDGMAEDERPLERLTKAMLSYHTEDFVPFEGLEYFISEMTAIRKEITALREQGYQHTPRQYYDRDGREILEGTIIQNELGGRKMVYATPDNDLGIPYVDGERCEPAGPLDLLRPLEALHHHTDGNDTLGEWYIAEMAAADAPAPGHRVKATHGWVRNAREERADEVRLMGQPALYIDEILKEDTIPAPDVRMPSAPPAVSPIRKWSSKGDCTRHMRLPWASTACFFASTRRIASSPRLCGR